MPDINGLPEMQQVTAAPETIQHLAPPTDKPKKTVNDWVRDLRMSASVNKTTVGVESDRVTPELLLATSNKLLGISRRQVESDPKDSLEFQRIYGPQEYFSEHILRDANKVGRNLLWKATNRGNVDFMPTAALDQHVSDVFYNSKLAQMIDGSSPLETVDASFKLTRIGEGGVMDVDSAPDEMRLVQPSFLGYIDSVRSPESLRVGLDAYMAKHVMKGRDGKLYQRFINAHTGKEELVDSVTAAKSVVTTPDMMQSNTNYIYAVGGKTGVRIVKKNAVDYYLPTMDEAFSMAANLVPAMSGVKEMRLLMGCLHPLTNIITISQRNEINILPAKAVKAGEDSLPGADNKGIVQSYKMRTTLSKFPLNRSWFRKIVFYSGRSVVTSRDHKWPVVKDGGITLKEAEKLRNGDKIMRSLFKDLPNRRTFINNILINRDIAVLIGYAVRTLAETYEGNVRITYEDKHKDQIIRALDKLKIKAYKFYPVRDLQCLAICDPLYIKWFKENVCLEAEDRKVPSVILSAHVDIAAAFLDAYTADETQIGMDALDYTWIFNIPNNAVRDGLALLLNRTGSDSLYRDAYLGDGEQQIALKVVEPEHIYGDCVLDEVKVVLQVPNAPIMVDIDIDDNMYAVGNGLVTHNSKYPLQAVSITGRETPLVQPMDERTGTPMAATIGKFLGARFSPKAGTVSAVRKDRIDMVYDDGTKGSVALYNNYPMNAKGYIDNTPQVKAGMHINKGGLLASSNYTDNKGNQATGTNLRTGWISWKGGTYEDAVVLSESAAKKLTSTTMYSTNLDMDKTITLGKQNYQAWKPDEYTAEQLSVLDKDGIVKPGSILQKGDPMVLAVRTTEPSPGTLGKRVLTDVSETWEHDHPGIVTDIVRTRNGVRVLATVTAPVEVGDKVSGMFGNKGVCSKILPDDQMPMDKDGKPLEMLLSPLGLVSRCNPSQLTEALLGKVAHKTGVQERYPAFFNGDSREYVLNKLKQNRLTAEDTFIDPETGRKIEGVVNGYSYIHKLKHLSESKLSARGTDEYSSDETPGGSAMTGSKRFGGLEIGALTGHNAFQTLLDAKLIRGQSNTDFWRSIRTGGIPTIPGEPLVQRKFFSHLQGAGVNIRKTPKGISIFAMDNKDVVDLAGPRELKTKDTYEAKNFRPIDGGLFGQDIFGINGDKWAYIQLDEPVPNPVMEEPLAKLLRLKDKEFESIVNGTAEVNGMKNTTDMAQRLAGINLESEARQALQEFKNAPDSKKSAALKRYTAVEHMRRAGVNPAEYMLTKIPVLPPIYRPVSSHNGLTMVADANYLYAQLMDARDDMREAKDLPEEYQAAARKNLNRTWKELVGLYDPEDVKLRNKNVGGLLQWALGKGSPKFSAFQRKVLGMSVDTVGRGVIVPNARLTVDQVGIPIEMGFGIMRPFVERELVKRGYSPVQAMKMVKKQTPQAFDVLKEVVKTHPVEINRAPTLHKYNILALEPVLVQGHAIQIHPSICPELAGDFDGDSLANMCGFFEKVCYSNDVEETKTHQKLGVQQMINSSEKCLFKPFACTLEDLKTVEGSEVKKSDTVTEWDVDGDVYVDTVDPKTGARVKARVTKVSKHENLNMFDCAISTIGSYKHILTVSEDHSLITLNPRTCELELTKPEDAAGRCVPRVVQSMLNSPEDCSNTVKIDKDYAATYELGFFIGAMLGDGWIDAHNICRIACCDDSLGKYLLDLLKKDVASIDLTEDACLFSYNYSETDKQRFSKNDAKRITVYATSEFKREFKTQIGDTAWTKRIPRSCFAACEEHLIGVLMGLLATDGSVAYSEGTAAKKSKSKTILISTTSPYLRDGIQELCVRLGVRSGATAYKGKNSKHTCYAVTLSIRDIARVYKKHENLWDIHHRKKQDNFMKIIHEVENSKEEGASFDIVPCPVVLRCPLSWAGASAVMGTEFARVMGRGNMPRATARKLIPMLESAEWSSYNEHSSMPGKYKFGLTPEKAASLVKRWIEIVNDDSIAWETVDKVTPSTCTVGWDCTVPGPYTFTVAAGTVVQDTVNIHVPVSDNARKEAMDKMRPSRNLIAISDRKIMNKPEKEYMQGLYFATRINNAQKTQYFNTVQDAKEAYRKGVIDIDTPIEIRNK